MKRVVSRPKTPKAWNFSSYVDKGPVRSPTTFSRTLDTVRTKSIVLLYTLSYSEAGFVEVKSLNSLKISDLVQEGSQYVTSGLRSYW